MGLQPVAFFSAKMSDAERNYDVREQEFMALFKACLHWRHYLHGTQPFTLLTDHDSLKYHKTMPNLSGRLARWMEKMAEFEYELKHIPGKDNVVADALSRRADYAAVNALVQQQRRSILKRSVSFVDANPFAVLAAARAQREPESPEQRQRNIDAATKNTAEDGRFAGAEERWDDHDSFAALFRRQQQRRAVRSAHSGSASLLEPSAARFGLARAELADCRRRARPLCSAGFAGESLRAIYG